MAGTRSKGSTRFALEVGTSRGTDTNTMYLHWRGAQTPSANGQSKAANGGGGSAKPRQQHV